MKLINTLFYPRVGSGDLQDRSIDIRVVTSDILFISEQAWSYRGKKEENNLKDAMENWPYN